ncbi:hypothetical protein Tco_0518344 [Tanacetum coccineum]
MDQSDTGVDGLCSSRIGFNHFGLCLIFGRWAESVSFESYMFAVSGIDDRGAGGCDEPEEPESCLFYFLRSESGEGGGGS